MLSVKKEHGTCYSCPACQVHLLEIRTDFATAYFVCQNRRCRKSLLFTMDGGMCDLVVSEESKQRDRKAFNTIRCPKCNRFIMDIRTDDATVSVRCSDKRCKELVGIEMSTDTLSVSVSK